MQTVTLVSSHLNQADMAEATTRVTATTAHREQAELSTSLVPAESCGSRLSLLGFS